MIPWSEDIGRSAGRQAGRTAHCSWVGAATDTEESVVEVAFVLLSKTACIFPPGMASPQVKYSTNAGLHIVFGIDMKQEGW